MAKSFSHIKIGSILNIYDIGFNNQTLIEDRCLRVTNIDEHGDELYISYVNSQFNHTVKVRKNETSCHVKISSRKWYNHRRHMPKYLRHLVTGRQYIKAYKRYKYDYYITCILS